MQQGLPHEKNFKEALNLGWDQIRTKPGSKGDLHGIQPTSKLKNVKSNREMQWLGKNKIDKKSKKFREHVPV